MTSFVLFYLFPVGQSMVTFNYKNQCNDSIWLGSISIPSIGDIDPEYTPGTSKIVQMPDQWRGFIWARTKCSQNASSYFSCETGDCGYGKKICDSPVPNVPVTLLNFSITNSVVSYELSLNHGQNVPVRIQPVGGSLVDGTGLCPVADCVQDFSTLCPPDLVAKDKNGQYVGCYSACDAYKDPRYCCSGPFATPQACKPNEYSNIFKKACNLAHTYWGDNQPPIHRCARATSYNITFCPA